MFSFNSPRSSQSIDYHHYQYLCDGHGNLIKTNHHEFVGSTHPVDNNKNSSSFSASIRHVSSSTSNSISRPVAASSESSRGGRGGGRGRGRGGGGGGGDSDDSDNSDSDDLPNVNNNPNDDDDDDDNDNNNHNNNDVVNQDPASTNSTSPQVRRPQHHSVYRSGRYKGMLKYRAAMNYSPTTFVFVTDVGDLTVECDHCHALKFNGEKPGICCNHGKVSIPVPTLHRQN